jgi:hypothetical protein
LEVYHKFGGFVSINEHYAVVLADLQQMKTDAEAGIAAIQRLLTRGRTETAAIKPIKIVEPEPLTLPGDEISIPSQVLAFLNANPSRSYTAMQIRTGIGGDVNIKTLRGALSRLAGKKIERQARGKFRAKKLVGVFSPESFGERPESGRSGD